VFLSFGRRSGVVVSKLVMLGSSQERETTETQFPARLLSFSAEEANVQQQEQGDKDEEEERPLSWQELMEMYHILSWVFWLPLIVVGSLHLLDACLRGFELLMDGRTRLTEEELDDDQFLNVAWKVFLVPGGIWNLWAAFVHHHFAFHHQRKPRFTSVISAKGIRLGFGVWLLVCFGLLLERSSTTGLAVGILMIVESTAFFVPFFVLSLYLFERLLWYHFHVDAEIEMQNSPIRREMRYMRTLPKQRTEPHFSRPYLLLTDFLIFNTIQCEICLNWISLWQTFVELRCSSHHCFHKYCMEKWSRVSTDCPSCRQSIANSLPETHAHIAHV